MYDIIKDNMECVNVAKAAMEKKRVSRLFATLSVAVQMVLKFPSWASLPLISLLA